MIDRKFISIFLLLIVLVSPIAFAAELKIVKVSDLKPGDIIVDKNGNEIPVSTLTTQESQTKTISEIIKEKVFGNKQVNYDYNPGKKNTYQVLASGNSGPGTLVTGNSIFSNNGNLLTGYASAYDEISTLTYQEYVDGINSGTISHSLYKEGTRVQFKDGLQVISGSGYATTSTTVQNSPAPVLSTPEAASPGAQTQKASTTPAADAIVPGAAPASFPSSDKVNALNNLVDQNAKAYVVLPDNPNQIISYQTPEGVTQSIYLTDSNNPVKVTEYPDGTTTYLSEGGTLAIDYPDGTGYVKGTDGSEFYYSDKTKDLFVLNDPTGVLAKAESFSVTDNSGKKVAVTEKEPTTAQAEQIQQKVENTLQNPPSNSKTITTNSDGTYTYNGQKYNAAGQPIDSSGKVIEGKSSLTQESGGAFTPKEIPQTKSPPATYKPITDTQYQQLIKDGFGSYFEGYDQNQLYTAPDGAILGTLDNGKTYTQLSRGSVDTIFGQLSFGWGNIWQGVAWAGAAVGLIQTFGGIFGEDKSEINALSGAAAAGIFAGKVSYALLGKGGWGGFLRNADGSVSTTGSVLGSPWTAGAIGAGTAWLVYNSMYKKVDSKTEIVNFQCLPWQAPHGGADCELCNDPNLPCSEYRCKSLGQSCKLINEGTSKEMCINANPRDVSPPVISPEETNLTIGLYYDNVKEMPPGAGFEIKDSNTTTGCIKPYTPITFGITTATVDGIKEPSQCKIDVEGGKNYSEMATYFGGDSIYSYNHTETLSLPSTSDFANSSLTLENGKQLSFFIRCIDANGNANEADYQVKMCVDPSPDTTAPQILGTSINSGSCVAANTDNSTIQFYVNEPATCKWSFDDMNYNQMQNNMSCSTSAIQVNALQVFSCSTTLTGIARDGTNFYVRCNDTAGNPNQQSYPFSLKGSNPLKLTNLQPNSTIYGAVRPAPVELYAQTLFGCDGSQAICYYSTTGTDSSYVQFFDTNKPDGISTQRLDLNEGSYTYFIKCVDSGGNVVVNTTTFNLQIDTNAPVIARAYEEDNYLKIVTPRDSDCVYTNDNCDFLFDEGTVMPYSNTSTHVTPWQADKTYYIKCRDEFKSEPTDCSLIVKPTSNFL